MQDRRLDHQRGIGRIRRGARIARAGGEADLVVDDEVDGAAGLVALQPHQHEAFGDHALAGEGRVAVQQQRQHLAAVGALVDAEIQGLFGARLAQDHRVDDLQVRGIGGQRQVHAVAVELTVRRGAQVVLHVARALDVGGERGPALELVQDHAIGLAHHRGQHVQAAPVRHADDDLVHAQRAAALDDLLQRRDHGFRAVQAEALGAGEALVQEALEAFALDQLLEDGDLAFRGEDDLLVLALDALLQPRLLLRVGDVHELHAEIAAVGATQDRQDLADARALEAQHIVEEDRAIVVRLGEAVGRGLQLGVLDLGLDAQRIQVGRQMAADAVGADHHDRAHRIQGGGAHVGLGSRRLLLDDGLGHLGLDRGPEAIDGRQPVRALDGGRGAGPARLDRGGGDGLGGLAQAFEIGAPGRLYRARVLGVSLI